MNSWLTHLGDYSIYLYFPSVSQKRHLDSVQSRFVLEWITARYWGNCKLNSASETIKTSFQKWRNGLGEVWVTVTPSIWAGPKQAELYVHLRTRSQTTQRAESIPWEGLVFYLQESGSILTADNLSSWMSLRLENNCLSLHKAWQSEGCEVGYRWNDNQGFLKKPHIYYNEGNRKDGVFCRNASPLGFME